MTKLLKTLTLTSLAVLAAGAVNAADPNPYVSLKTGYVDGNIELSKGSFGMFQRRLDGFTGAIAGGAAFEVRPFLTLRSDLEYAYSETSKDSMLLGKVNVQKHTVMINGYADLGEKTWAVKPYVGLGLGCGFGNAGPVHDKQSLQPRFAYAGMLGAAYTINSHWALDLGAKYSVLDTSVKHMPGGGLDTLTLTDTSYLLGVRYSF